jgi:hypothetical protein
MKSFFILLFPFIFLSAEAQLVFSPSKTFVMYLNKNKLHYDGIMIHNQSNDTVKLIWDLVSIDTIPGSYFDFCASGECYIGIPSTGSFPKINPLDSGFSKMHFWTGNITGTCKAVVYVYELGNSENGDTLTYYLHVTEPNSVVQSEVSDFLNIYPNPAGTFLNIRMPAEITYGYTVYDITGKEIISSRSKGLHSIPINMLTEGLYILSVKDIDGNTFAKRFRVEK